MTNKNDPAELVRQGMAESTGIALEPPTPAEREVLDWMDLPEQLAALDEQFAAVEPVIQAEWRELVADAGRAMLSDKRVTELRSLGQELRSAHQTYSAAVDKLMADGELTDRDRDIYRQRASDERDVARADIMSRAKSAAAELRSRWPERTATTVSEKIAAGASIVLQKYTVAPPQSFLRDFLQVQKVVANTDQHILERERLTGIIEHGYLPGLERRASKPETFSEPYQKHYARAAKLGRMHVDTWRGLPYHRAAHGYAIQAVQTLGWLDEMARGSGWDDTGVLERATGEILEW
jgi:hypothetical protein